MLILSEQVTQEMSASM